MTKCCVCDTNPRNGDNFGGLCDSCNTARKSRNERTRAVLRAYGQENTEFGRAIGA